MLAPATFLGDCRAGKPLNQDEAAVITQRIFPGNFNGGTYDAKTCAFIRDMTDGGR